MSADATLLLNAVEASLAATFPGVACYQSKRRAAGGKQQEGGYAEGYRTPCFVLSCSDPERVDDAGSFETYTLRYSVLVEYVKPAQQKVTGGEGKPAPVVEDPAVRDVREQLYDTLYTTQLAGVPRLLDTRTAPRGAYDLVSGGTYVATGIAFTYDIWRTRPGA